MATKAYIVGAGPGDPGLLTLAAMSALSVSDVILYDRLVSDAVLALAPKESELIYVGKLEGEQNSGQRKIYQKLIKAVNEGKVVTRLKGGEPLVFGRGGEEWEFLKSLGCDVRYIPGISSALAVPGLAGIPLTGREVSSSFAVVTAVLKDGELSDFSKYASVDTLVVLMGVKHRDYISRSLIEFGRSGHEPVAFIENGSLDTQRLLVTNLFEVAAGETAVNSPAVMVVGQVVNKRDALKRTLEFSQPEKEAFEQGH